MGFNESDLKKIDKDMKNFIVKHRTPVEIENGVDISYSIEKDSVLIFEVSPAWDNPAEKVEVPIAKATFVKESNTWKIFRQKSDDKWHKYEQLPEVKTFGEFLDEVEEDKHEYFWG